uniref:hypothetical protein n=1 Tax=Herbidospora sakaeratensis TaxID=564415 RepID=UPI000AD48C53|nr:hypothetical protein [Herbidospora sakaeratensis]
MGLIHIDLLATLDLVAPAWRAWTPCSSAKGAVLLRYKLGEGVPAVGDMGARTS